MYECGDERPRVAISGDTLFSYSVLQLGMAAFYNAISSVNDSSDSKSKCSTSAVAHHTNQHLEDGWGGRGMDFPIF